MPRRLWLGNAQALVDVADADLAGQQQAEDAQPGRIAERLEEGRHPVEWLLHMCVDKYSTTGLDLGIREREYASGVSGWSRSVTARCGSTGLDRRTAR